jgi:hypothetical protein
MPFPPQVFAGITPSHFAAIVSEVQKETGVVVSGNSGTASQSGFTFSWTYDPPSGMLSIVVINKPWVIPYELIQTKIDELVGGN